MMVPTIIVVMFHLSRRENQSISELSRDCKVLSSNIYFYVSLLEKLGYINLVMRGRKYEMRKLQKFYDDIHVYKDLYDVLSKAEK